MSSDPHAAVGDVWATWFALKQKTTALLTDVSPVREAFAEAALTFIRENGSGDDVRERMNELATVVDDGMRGIRGDVDQLIHGMGPNGGSFRAAFQFVDSALAQWRQIMANDRSPNGPLHTKPRAFADAIDTSLDQLLYGLDHFVSSARDTLEALALQGAVAPGPSLDRGGGGGWAL